MFLFIFGANSCNDSEGKNAVASYRKLMGSTDPKKADDNTIRKLYGISIDKNSVHGSDSNENAKKEIDFFFKKLSMSIKPNNCLWKG